ncbi:MAG: response regulator transcription factor [Longilinea sp.]|nr:response regulator transcription factor [Longilinea sp.]
MNMVRLALVDDHAVVRRGMRAYFEAFADIEVVGEAGSAEEALRCLAAWRADVVLMDLLLPGGMDGLQATRRMRTLPNPPQVVVLTAYADAARAQAARREGAIGYVRKDAQPEVLLAAVRAAGRGEPYLDPLTAHALQNVDAEETLSGREQEVLEWMARGHTNREIAEALMVSEQTVKTHVGSILSKLGTENRIQAVAAARRRGWLREDAE